MARENNVSNFGLVFFRLPQLQLCPMNVIKSIAKTVGIICVPVAFFDYVGTIGIVEGTSMEVGCFLIVLHLFILADSERQGYCLAT
jgi:hypothetical protein